MQMWRVSNQRPSAASQLGLVKTLRGRLQHQSISRVTSEAEELSDLASTPEGTTRSTTLRVQVRVYGQPLSAENTPVCRSAAGQTVRSKCIFKHWQAPHHSAHTTTIKWVGALLDFSHCSKRVVFPAPSRS